MFKKNKKHEHGEQGMVALFPAIIISSILIILSVSVSRSFLSSLYRTTIFDQKVQSEIIAHSCISRVLAKHMQDNNYRGGETIYIANSPCIVAPFLTNTFSVTVKLGEAVSIENVTF